MKKVVFSLLHVGYWVLFGLLLLTFFLFAVFIPLHARTGSQPPGSMLSWFRLMTAFAILPGLLSFYTSYFFLFSHFLHRQRFLWFFIGSILTALSSALFVGALASLPALLGKAFLFGDGFQSALPIVILMTTLAWVNAIIGAVLKGFLTWYQDIKLKDELRHTNLETELALLKSRIDPHFLFNTINNIDILITKDPVMASSYLNQLSGIMRFVLYETKNERISLDREVEYLRQYLALQKIRTSNDDYVRFELTGQTTGRTVAPMLLLPFIENAFKHTEQKKAGSRISIHLSIEKKKLIFVCVNTLLPLKNPSADSGLGNTLIRKRLALLYPDSHDLTIRNDANLYQVKLELNL